MKPATSIVLVAALGTIQYPSAEPGAYFGIEPGETRRAEVELRLGEPIERVAPHVFAYAPPREVDDTSRVEISFFEDTDEVARIDVFLEGPARAETLRNRFGTRILTRERARTGLEEVHYPKLFAVILPEAGAAQALGIGYLSPRYVADLYAERFNEAIREERLEDAKVEADKAVLVAPDYARGHAGLAIYHELREEWDKAIDAHRAAIETGYPPRLVGRAHSRLGQLYSRLGRSQEKVEAELREGVAVAPGLGETRVNLGNYLAAEERYGEAKEQFEAALAIDESSYAARAGLANALYALDDYAGARPHYEYFHELATSDSPPDFNEGFVQTVLFRLGYCSGETGEPGRAADLFDRYLESAPDSRAAWQNLGYYALRAGEAARAVSAYREAVRLDPDDFILHRDLGRALLEAGRPNEALEQHQRTLALRPESTAQMIHIARAYAALDEKGACLRWLRKAADTGHTNGAHLASDPYLRRYADEDDFQEILERMQ